MKKNIKVIALIYVGVALFAYALSLRVESLESKNDLRNHNQSIVLRIQ